jgi:hypothetical protein
MAAAVVPVVKRGRQGLMSPRLTPRHHCRLVSPVTAGPDVPVSIDVVKGDLITEVRQVFSEWATHVIRLVEGEGHVEVEWTAGPIPIDTPWIDPVVQGHDNIWGKEVIVKYTSSIKSAGSFYTDSNGREMVPRQYNARGPSYPPLVVHEPVAGNYYPVNNMIALEDSSADLALTVLTDVSQGGSSLADGELELMVHRRVQDDDSRGVQEPLNETMYVPNCPVTSQSAGLAS